MSEIEQQLNILNAALTKNPTDADALYQRGSLYMKLGNLAAAKSDFTASANINPKGPGATALTLVSDIIDFYHTDLYNP